MAKKIDETQEYTEKQTPELVADQVAEQIETAKPETAATEKSTSAPNAAEAVNTLKPTAVACGSELIRPEGRNACPLDESSKLTGIARNAAETAGAGELASPRMDSPLERVEDLATLADRHRIPTWQQAALCRLMDWQDGKMVTDTDYTHALGLLKTRRLGGGHKG